MLNMNNFKPVPRYVPPSIDDILGHEAIQKALWDSAGSVKEAALKLQCDQSALYRYLDKYPESKEIRDEAKKHFKRSKVEEREKLLYALQEQKKNAPVSFAAIKYYLDTHGQEEGWGKITEQANEEQAKAELGKWGDYLETLRTKATAPHTPEPS
jgi:hypothetical protein